jgi:hypothetical protein
MKKKKHTVSQIKDRKVMREFREGELHSGKTETIVTNSKQPIAIALSEARKPKKMKNQ